MNLDDIRAELEDELTWRMNEMRFLRNRLSDLSDADDQERYCKSLVVMLYAHFEGFWKAAFTIYLSELNRMGLQCGNASESIIAASMAELFHSLNDPNKKSDFFRGSAPDDTVLHRFCRHAEFAGKLHDVLASTIDIPIDVVLDTESNLTPTVVRKTLFRMGFDHEEFKGDEGIVNQLLRRRNDIAHGSARSGIRVEVYRNLEASVLGIMRRIVTFIFEALDEQKYLRSVPSGP
ncbi:MAE_28990/MAE_18760 family HEPN-like nuclease [Planctomicrobium sp. SH527]|uniref:MAE_28990/MAE_18760 family HEPN-like nuclease n=1 Tax=Planctomicrobium sp. SH527 TaxID=3448123 RepID=UPI003F5C9790